MFTLSLSLSSLISFSCCVSTSHSALFLSPGERVNILKSHLCTERVNILLGWAALIGILSSIILRGWSHPENAAAREADRFFPHSLVASGWTQPRRRAAPRGLADSSLSLGWQRGSPSGRMDGRSCGLPSPPAAAGPGVPAWPSPASMVEHKAWPRLPGPLHRTGQAGGYLFPGKERKVPRKEKDCLSQDFSDFNSVCSQMCVSFLMATPDVNIQT